MVSVLMMVMMVILQDARVFQVDLFHDDGETNDLTRLYLDRMAGTCVTLYPYDVFRDVNLDFDWTSSSNQS